MRRPATKEAPKMVKTKTPFAKAQGGIKTKIPLGATGRRVRVQPAEWIMGTQCYSDIPPSLALELFQPNPNVLYSLDATAHIAGVSRRSILIYCRAGLVRPLFQQPYDVLAFTGEAIHTVRRIEHVRAVHGIDVAWIKIMFALLDEVESLRAEVRFLRRH
jgi:hypothetical protein